MYLIIFSLYSFSFNSCTSKGPIVSVKGIVDGERRYDIKQTLNYKWKFQRGHQLRINKIIWWCNNCVLLKSWKTPWYLQVISRWRLNYGRTIDQGLRASTQSTKRKNRIALFFVKCDLSPLTAWNGSRYEIKIVIRLTCLCMWFTSLTVLMITTAPKWVFMVKISKNRTTIFKMTIYACKKAPWSLYPYAV